MNDCNSCTFGVPDLPTGFQGDVAISPVQTLAAVPESARRLLSSKPLLRAARRGVRRCLVYLTAEEDGGFSIVSADLPGVASQGETVEEAIENIEEAFRGVIRSYRDEGRAVPWLATPEEPEPGAIARSVVVHV